MSYNSKYSGEEVEQLLDQVASGNAGGVSEDYVDNAIANAVTNVINASY